MNLASDGSTLVRDWENTKQKQIPQAVSEYEYKKKKNTGELSGLRLEAEVGIILH